MTSAPSSTIQEIEDQSRLYPVRVWLVGVLGLILMMVAVGGITRLTESGLSITEWQPIMGTIPPIGEAAWQEAFELYKQYPQYEIMNPNMTLDEFRVIFFWEYVHRLLGRIIGVAFALPYLWFLFTRRLRAGLAFQLLIGFVLGGLQGVLGWYMVMSGLVDVPRVSHFRLAAHLSLAFVIFAYLLWVLLSLHPKRRGAPDAQPTGLLWKLATGFAVLLVIQIAYGAFTAGLRAGYAFNTWPKMMNHWLPPGWLGFEPAWRNFFENVITVQFIHRTLAYPLVAIAIALAWQGCRRGVGARLRVWLFAVPLLTFVQFALGVVTILLVVPITWATLHQVTACLLVGATTGLFYDLFEARRSANLAEA